MGDERPMARQGEEPKICSVGGEAASVSKTLEDAIAHAVSKITLREPTQLRNAMEQTELVVRDWSKLQQGQKIEAQEEEGEDDWVYVSDEMVWPSDEGKTDQICEAVTVYDYQMDGQAVVTEGHEQQQEEESDLSVDSRSNDSESEDAATIQLDIIPNHFCGIGRVDWWSLQLMAEVAAKICESARVAVNEASRAGAGLLLQAVLPATTIPKEERKEGRNLLCLWPCQDTNKFSPGRELKSVGCEGPSNSGQPGTSVAQNYVGPGMLAVAKGDIFQWCMVSKLSTWQLQCQMDLAKFLDTDLTAIGISAHAPLTLTIASHSYTGLLVDVSQPLDALPVHRSRLGPYFLVPHAVNLYFKTSTQGGSGGNFFLDLMRRMAWYLSNLNFICCICQKRSFMPSGEVQSCRELPCLATFNAWVHVAPCVPPELRPGGFQKRLKQMETRLKKLNLSEDELRHGLQWHKGKSEGQEVDLIQDYARVLASEESTAEHRRRVPHIYVSPPGFIEVPFQD